MTFFLTFIKYNVFMKNKFLIIIMIIVFFFFDATISYAKKKTIIKEKTSDKEIRAIYISYIEYLNNFSGGSKKINQAKISKMIDNISENKLNNIFLHVSPFSDSIYESKLFPYSYTLTGNEDNNPGFDYLEFFIKKAHAKNIKIHAWINPYRISFNSNINLLSNKNPAKKLANTSSVKEDKNGIYYNPASEIVKNLIVRQVEEIIDKYEVDGIHFDDYFYVQKDIDNVEYINYKNNGGKLSLKEFRLNNTNDLIKRVYKTIKEKNKQIIFSIAPDGNINNNYLYHFADVKTWLKNSEYIDIIMPQIYYGFNNEYAPFEKVLDSWMKLCINDNIKIIPVLAKYKEGKIDNEAGRGKDEWVNNTDIINMQIKFIKNKNLDGYALFRYEFLINDGFK